MSSRWAPALLTALGVGLLPWTLWLGVSLPSRKVAAHWDLAWVGFDLALAAALLGTAAAVVGRRPFRRSLAAATGTLLVSDAWFDVVTSETTRERWFAAGLAVLVEVPIALLCFVLARPGGRDRIGR